MKRTFVGLIAAIGLLAGGQALATGFGGSDAPPARIPVPAKDFRAVVEDASGVRVECTQVTWNGEVFLYGKLGDGQVTVPFERITEVRFEPSNEPGKRIAFVKLRDGSSVSFAVETDVPAYGKTVFGFYSITSDRLRKIEFPAQ